MNVFVRMEYARPGRIKSVYGSECAWPGGIKSVYGRECRRLTHILLDALYMVLYMFVWLDTKTITRSSLSVRIMPLYLRIHT